MSDKVRSWIEAYVKEHWPGNPQIPLTRIPGFEPGPKPQEVYMRVLCPLCGAHHDVTIKCSRGRGPQ